MKVGSLVKRKPAFGKWVKYNPWMLTDKDLEIGIIIEMAKDLAVIHWPSVGPKWESRNDLEKIA